MRIGIPKEIHADERRVAASPGIVQRFVQEGFDVLVESGAGEAAGFSDVLYEEAGARIGYVDAVYGEADILAKVRPPEEREDGRHEADLLREGALLVSFLFPAQNEALVQRLAARKVSALAIDCIPRISRAQKVDALSSMANIAGYRAVIEAANRFGSFFTGQYTAAGKVPPAKVLVIGAGVAGLAAIAAARGLGAIVRAFDTRRAVRDQVESLGGEFLELEFEEEGEGKGGYAKVMSEEFIAAEMALFREQAKEVNIVVTTALVPGKKAPILWTRDMVEAMKPGSVVVDLAAEQGGNCELTSPGEIVTEHGVTIIGYVDLTSRMANVASDLYGNNLLHLFDEMGGAEGFTIDLENDIVRGSLVLRDGELVWPPPPPKEEPAPEAPAEPKEPAPAAPATAAADEGAPAKPTGPGIAVGLGLVAAALWLWLRFTRGDATLGPDARNFLQHLTVFVLAVIVGWQVIWNVTPALHTPLMSVTNAISGIIVIGAIVQGTSDATGVTLTLGAIATLFATINVVGGFHVTRRMLHMFRK